MATQIALLRGINVGKTKRLAMADLRALLEELGFTDVRTYVQSGNVVFAGPKAGAAKKIEAGIAERFGFDVPVIVRTEAELAAVVEANPLKAVADDDAKHLVSFLSKKVPAATLDDVDREAFAPEEFVLAGTELYLWCPGGVHKSKLAKKLSDRKLGAIATARNWRTVEKLLAMAREG